MNRRRFLKTVAAGTTAAVLTPLHALARDEQRLVILHTNDTHSRIDPFPMDGRSNQGLGGAARRATVIRRIRERHPNVLLLDSGDIFQGTPYFNFFDGEVEFKTMSALGYDVATLGNHDFDNGTDGLTRMLPHAEFDFVSANYEITDPMLAARVKPYQIRSFGGVRVGIFGLGIDLHQLVLPQLHEGVAYTDPVLAARQSVDALRQAGCAYVICLSHLGHRYQSDRVSDHAIAHEVPGIDLILGGHTHTFLDQPDVVQAPGTEDTVVHQVGWGGIRLGRVDVVFGAEGTTQRWYGSYYPVDARLDRLT